MDREQQIIEAAEMEFLEYGFKKASTVTIAAHAGVTHSMLHYYFRTKALLFKKVFQRKVQLVSDSFLSVMNENLPFEETIRKFTESHFDFVRQNPKLFNFIYNEVITNEENGRFLIQQLHPNVSNVLNRLEKMMNDEVAKRNVRPIKALDLLMNIMSMNVITFMTIPVIESLSSKENSEYFERFTSERRENNVQFVLDALKK